MKMEGSSPTRHSAPAELVTSSEWKYLPENRLMCSHVSVFMRVILEVENLLAAPSFIKMRKLMLHEEGRG